DGIRDFHVTGVQTCALPILGSATLLSLPVGARAQTAFSFITPFTLSLAFAPVLYAEAAGYYGDEGLEMNLQAGKGAALAAQMTIDRKSGAKGKDVDTAAGEV